jgi:hypothetical protein
MILESYFSPATNFKSSHTGLLAFVTWGDHMRTTCIWRIHGPHVSMFAPSVSFLYSFPSVPGMWIDYLALINFYQPCFEARKAPTKFISGVARSRVVARSGATLREISRGKIYSHLAKTFGFLSRFLEISREGDRNDSLARPSPAQVKR